MAKLIGLKIDVTKITKEKLFKGVKGTYLDLTIALNDELDQYGNNVSVWEKCEKTEQKNYLGNGKVFWESETAKKKEEVHNAVPATEEDTDDLPF